MEWSQRGLVPHKGERAFGRRRICPSSYSALVKTVGSFVHFFVGCERACFLVFRMALQASIVAAARPGDHVLCMSNGGFGGIHDKLLAALLASAATAHTR
jgi:aspartate aminotransferase-like enzyme